MTDFDGRTILVTGASGGSGDATVRQLVAAGADGDGASMITGVSLPIDGGFTCQ